LIMRWIDEIHTHAGEAISRKQLVLHGQKKAALYSGRQKRDKPR
jgi:hypothetical protein